MSVNTKYNVSIEILAPLHIGGGAEKDWVKGADFVQDKNKIYKLNQRKLTKSLDIGVLSNILMNKDDIMLKEKISGNLDAFSDYTFDSPCATDNDIKTFIKNGLTNTPVLAGSSIKGAIRSILFKHLKSPHEDKDQRVFGSPTKGDEFMRFLKFSDIQFEKTNLVNTKIFNLGGQPQNLFGAWKHSRNNTDGNINPVGFNTIYEVIEPKQKSFGTIAVADKQFLLFERNSRRFPTDKREIITNDLKNKLFSIINEHTYSYIEKEILFFEQYSASNTDKIIETLQNIKRAIPSDNSSCVFKMSAGSGFHSITGDWQHETYSINGIFEKKNKFGKVTKRQGTLNNDLSAKSRKIACSDNYFGLMGFVQLSVVSDDEIQRISEEKRQKIMAAQLAIELKIKEKADQEAHILEEKRLKTEAEKAAERKRLNEIKAKEEQRQAELQREADDLDKRQKANKKAKEDHSKLLLKSGLIILEELNNFKQDKKIIIDFFKATNEELICDDNLDNLKQFVMRCIVKSNKRWEKEKDKDWKLVIKWIGKETAEKWFNEFKQKKML